MLVCCDMKIWTSARVTSFDADHCQCVDAAQAEHQRKETVHLGETERTGYRCVLVQAPPPSNSESVITMQGESAPDSMRRVAEM